MPTYDYVCQDCSHAFEHFQSMTSEPLQECPECQGKLRRLIGAGAALIFKGSGFYCTDYKKSSSTPQGRVERAKEASKSVKESSGSNGTGGSGEGKKGDKSSSKATSAA